MIKKLSFSILFLLSLLNSWGQIEITGIVIAKEDKLPLPGALVSVKGTEINTTTDINGKFSILVSNSDEILVFSFIGFGKKELELKGQTDISIVMKQDCNIDTFDHNQIGLLLSSGMINNPIGGQIDFSLPPFFHFTTLKSSLNYQTNFDDYYIFNASVELDHIILKCEFQSDIKWFYRSISSQNFESKVNSYESHAMFIDFHDLNIYNAGLIIGFNTINYMSNNSGLSNTEEGATFGFRATLGKPFFSTITYKVAFYKNYTEHIGQIRTDYFRFCGFMKFYKIDSYSELSLGLGIRLGY